MADACRSWLPRLGTPYEIRTAGTILFLEDVAAKPFQIDRMLMQLKLAGKLNDVRGIVFGEMLDCVQTANQDYTLEEVVLRVVGDLGIPVLMACVRAMCRAGNITLPIGVQARLTVRHGRVEFEDSGSGRERLRRARAQSNDIKAWTAKNTFI